MNANEAIANRALEHLGQPKGHYLALHPNDHVNASQSTNDVYPTALRVAAWFGINAPAGYAEMVVPLLASVSGVPVVRAANLVEATQDTGSFMQLSGVLKRVACKLSKVCNDLRLLSSEPQAGFGDIKLPARQAGSSIMPGQVNCVEGIEANHALLARRVAESVILVMALNPIIGYEQAALITKTALATGGTIAEVAEALGIMSRAEMKALLEPDKLTQAIRLVA